VSPEPWTSTGVVVKLLSDLKRLSNVTAREGANGWSPKRRKYDTDAELPLVNSCRERHAEDDRAATLSAERLVDVLSREEIEQLEGAALNETDNLFLRASPLQACGWAS
jgi:hypothetical protein